MSSKTRNRKTRTNTGTTGSTRTLRSVSDQGTAATIRTDTEDRLWTALHAYPNNAAPFLAGAANIGRSTAAKILAKWAKDGSVTRTPGIAEGGRRAADLWAITDTNIDTDVDTDSTEPTPDGESDLADTAQADATAPEPTDTEPTDETTDGGSTEPNDTAADHARNASHTGATDTEATGPTEAEPVGTEATKPAADRAATDAAADSGDRDGPVRRTSRPGWVCRWRGRCPPWCAGRRSPGGPG